MKYSLIVLESLWTNLGSSSVLIPFVPIVLGGLVTYFKPLLPTEEDFRKRSDFQKDVFVERANTRLQQLLSRMQDVAFSVDDLRGAPPGQPDLISDYTSEFSRAIQFALKLEKIYLFIRLSYTLLLGTIALAAVGLLLSIIFAASKPYVSLACLIIIIVQLVIVLLLRRSATRFEEIERTF